MVTSRASLYLGASILAGILAAGILAASQEPIPSAPEWGTDMDCQEYEDRDRDRAIGGGICAALVLITGGVAAAITTQRAA